ncbi:MAG TPA: response regulator [Candidatus Angelobacter sp.]|nr:response regulator [Candidatus Angelobacter sp.]
MEILLVEDDPRDVRLTMRELQAERYNAKIELARDGAEALDFLFCKGPYSQRPADRPPKLVLLDLKLPKIDGLQVLREIKGNPATQAIPVVILTSSKEEKDMIESYKLGVNSYIQKPVDFEQFRETIRTLGIYWVGVNQPPPDKTFTS